MVAPSKLGRLIYLALMLLPLCQGCINSLLLYPSTQPESAGGAQERKVDVKGKVVQVWVTRSAGIRDESPKARVLAFTGNATRAEWVAADLARLWGDHSVEVWVMNYPGYGGSAGPATVAAIPPAALGVYDAMASVQPGVPIIVSGNSLGCATALSVASHRPVAGMVLQNPPPIQRMIMQEAGWWNLWLGAGVLAMQVSAELDALATAPRVRAPAVFILSQQDRTVPYRYQQQVADAYAGEKRFLHRPTADHNTPLSSEESESLRPLLDWLWQSAVERGGDGTSIKRFAAKF
jgi:uncharacterized protein